ncbi:MAG TPA: Tol-Pal system beta propeller repeat protein TolB [Thiobacillaceae bacterium]|nr:Tol-Pal system beta propeller repeat protein TolB [Thiobacillaceae bacterium]
MPRSFAAVLTLLAALPVQAAMEIQIIGGAANKIPVALVPFQGPGDQPRPALTELIGNDLLRSGQFKLVDIGAGPQPAEPAQVNYKQWKNKGAEALSIGQVVSLPGGRFEVRFRLLDVVRQVQLAGYSYDAGADQWRATAHRIADVIYEKLTGLRGAFSSRIAYVQKRGKVFELKVADADGANPRSVVRSMEPLISPVFSPNGGRLAYVSFEDKKPVVYVQNLADGSRRAVAAFKGSNSAPAWSPDGSHLAVTLTRDNTSQIYLIGADGSGVTRLTQGSDISTEPVFSPDGKWIYFSSDRGGTPQIYKLPADGGEAKRVTFEGNYNVSPALSPDGKLMAYIRREGGRFQVAVMELESGQSRVLTDSAHDESPSFSPNGQMILYATVLGSKGILGTVSIDGRIRARLSEEGADAREPAWGR